MDKTYKILTTPTVFDDDVKNYMANLSSNKERIEAIQEKIRLENSLETIDYTPINGKYLPTEVVEQCFRDGVITNVDKTLMGNGFTHAFMYSISPAEGKVNLLFDKPE